MGHMNFVLQVFARNRHAKNEGLILQYGNKEFTCFNYFPCLDQSRNFDQ